MVDKDNFKRVCLYLTSCATYVAEPEDSEILKVNACSHRERPRLHSCWKRTLAFCMRIATKQRYVGAGFAPTCGQPLLALDAAVALVHTR
jgi:hypothetical protein